ADDDWHEADEPVLILDDVFAELDVRRRDRLAELIAPAEQVLITAAVAEDVPESLEGARADGMGSVAPRVRRRGCRRADRAAPRPRTGPGRPTTGARPPGPRPGRGTG